MCRGERVMKILAGFMVALSVFGLIGALTVSDGSVWSCAVTKVLLFFLACVGIIFSVVFLIRY